MHIILRMCIVILSLRTLHLSARGPDEVLSADDIQPVESQISFFGHNADPNFIIFQQASLVEVGVSLQSLASTGNPLNIRLYPSSRSRYVKYKGPALIPVFEQTDAGLQLVAAFRIEANHSKRVLVFLSRNPSYDEGSNRELKYYTHVLSDANKDLPAGHLRFLNFTRFEYDVWMSGKRVKVAPGLSQLYGDSETSSIQVKFFRKVEQSYEILFNLNIRIEDDSRYLMLLFPSSEPNDFRIQPKMLVDVVKKASARQEASSQQ
ncbi:hypothetical protein SH580_04775 [Coraliomargarita algicola]|uniref:Uncharacterized protein n=1 Tax=Coraliomargarita algicola TaxID=3092156 RepID=A0ABZ0RLC7_9BACT|nr:hypothetical protein [Coraliomargarita sp. J2-16]WPJ97020.1 hypothetical protein SH580_04775 [Coraliomargarita sp. J2-16]